MDNNRDLESSLRMRLEPPNAPRVTIRKGVGSHIAMIRTLREQQLPPAKKEDVKCAWSEETNSNNEHNKTSPANSVAKEKSKRPKSADRGRRHSFCGQLPKKNPKVALLEMDEAKLEELFLNQCKV